MVQKTAMRVVFPCLLYEEAFVKTSLVTLSDRRQARLTDKRFKKRLQAQEFTAPQNANRYNLIKARQFNSVFKLDRFRHSTTMHKENSTWE